MYLVCDGSNSREQRHQLAGVTIFLVLIGDLQVVVHIAIAHQIAGDHHGILLIDGIRLAIFLDNLAGKVLYRSLIRTFSECLTGLVLEAFHEV